MGGQKVPWEEKASVSDLTVEVERPKLIGEIVLERIRDLIVDKQLVPGQRVSENGLAARLKVSKTPVREALLQLRTVGLVTSENGALHVVRPSPRLVQQAYEVRAGLESLTAALAATRADEDELAAITEAANQSNVRAQADDIGGFRANDRMFHWLVASASKNDLAARQVMNYRDLCQALRQRDVMTDQVSRVCGQAHLDIAAAMRSHEAERSRDLMAEHILYVMARVLNSMQSSA